MSECLCVGDTQMISWKHELRHYLQTILRVLCERYRGVGFDKVQAALKFDHVFQAYFIMTQNTKIAVVTKKITFLDPHVLIHCVPDRSWTLEEKLLRSPRTKRWLSAFKASSCWWSGDLKKAMEEIDNLNSKTFVDSYQIHKYEKSFDPKEIGTYSHVKHSDSLTKIATLMLGMDNLECFAPGRMVHSGLPFFGATPDGIAVRNKHDFYILLNDTIENKSPPCKKTLKYGRIQLVMEFKTITSEQYTVSCMELDDIVKGTLHYGQGWGKEKAVETLQKKFCEAGWIPARLTNRSSDSEVLEMFTYRKTRLFPIEYYNKIKYRPISAFGYPNYVPWFDKLKNVCDGDMRATKKNINKYSSTIKPSKIANPGKAKIIIFNIKGEENEPIMQFDFDEAPFVIGYNSQHHDQIMLQHIVVNSYANKPCKSVYCVGLHASRLRDGTGSQSIRLAIVYMCELGLTRDSAIEFSERICTEMALAEQNRPNGSKLLTHHLIDSCKDIRISNLYNM